MGKSAAAVSRRCWLWRESCRKVWTLTKFGSIEDLVIGPALSRCRAYGRSAVRRGVVGCSGPVLRLQQVGP